MPRARPIRYLAHMAAQMAQRGQAGGPAAKEVWKRAWRVDHLIRAFFSLELCSGAAFL